MLRGVERLTAERDRLVGWVVDDAGQRVTVRAGDRVAFRYRGVDRVGVVVRPTKSGFVALVDGGSRAKAFHRDRVSDFSLLSNDFPTN